MEFSTSLTDPQVYLKNCNKQTKQLIYQLEDDVLTGKTHKEISSNVEIEEHIGTYTGDLSD